MRRCGSVWALVVVLMVTGCGDDDDDAAPDGAVDAAVDAAADAASLPAYPAGPYGLRVGDTFPDLAWFGYRDATGPWQPLRMSDYHDADGSRGIRGVWVSACAAWCAPCVTQAKDYARLMTTAPASYRARGARILTLLVEDRDGDPAAQADVDAWITTTSGSTDVAADPARLAFVNADLDPSADGSGLPYNFLIDPRTMRIVAIQIGVASVGGDRLAGLDQLLIANGASVRTDISTTTESVGFISVSRGRFDTSFDASFVDREPPPVGCVVTQTVSPCRALTCDFSAPRGFALNRSAGTVTISGYRPSIALMPQVTLAYPEVRSQEMPDWMPGDMLTFAASGGDVPAFTTTLLTPAHLALTEPLPSAAGMRLSRSSGAVVSWNGGFVGRAQLSLVRVDDDGAASHVVACSASATAGTLTIDPAVMATLPAGSGEFVFAGTTQKDITSGAFDVHLSVGWAADWGRDRALPGSGTLEVLP